jgi:SH3-like domain-containing protein
LNGQSLTSRGAAEPDAKAEAAKPASGISDGAVLSPKIAGVKLLATPADDAKVLATLAKTDQVVVIGAEKNGFVNVQGTTAAGWVKVVLFNKE